MSVCKTIGLQVANYISCLFCKLKQSFCMNTQQKTNIKLRLEKKNRPVMRQNEIINIINHLTAGCLPLKKLTLFLAYWCEKNLCALTISNELRSSLKRTFIFLVLITLWLQKRKWFFVASYVVTDNNKLTERDVDN